MFEAETSAKLWRKPTVFDADPNDYGVQVKPKDLDAFRQVNPFDLNEQIDRATKTKADFSP